jgi:hypothetical protein
MGDGPVCVGGEATGSITRVGSFGERVSGVVPDRSWRARRPGRPCQRLPLNTVISSGTASSGATSAAASSSASKSTRLTGSRRRAAPNPAGSASAQTPTER